MRAAQNQALCREVNERIEDLAEGYALGQAPRDFICECASTVCSQAITLTVGEYEAVRSNANRFVVAPTPQHVVLEVEEVVEWAERYWVVEKLGAGAEVAEKLDPRSR